MSDKSKWYMKIPNTYFILFFMLVLAAILTWVIPAGQYNRVASKTGRMLIENGTYHPVEKNPAGLFDIFVAIPKGIQGASAIVVMILISSGTIGLIRDTGALDNAIGSLLNKTKKLNIQPELIIFAATCLFSCLGLIIGPEIQIPFVIIAVSIALGLGFDLLTGAGMVIVGGGIGFALGPICASTVGTAHAICGLPLFSGLGLRTACWFVSTIVSAGILARYAKKVRAKPQYSYVNGISTEGLGLTKKLDEYSLAGRDKVILLIFFGLFCSLIIGPSFLGWYLDEMTAMFIIVAFIVGIVARYKTDDAVNIFITSAGKMFGAALMVGMGRSIQIIMENGNIMDTIIKNLSSPLLELGPYLAAPLMTIIHGIINFFIPSGSGQAAATMPIMFPVGQLIGLTDQTSVLAFQIGDGVTNLIFPTVGAIMAMLGIARVPFSKWVKFALRVVGAIYIITWIFLFIAIRINWGPF